MGQLGARRSYDWFLNKAQQLKEAAKRNPYQSQISHGQLISLNMYIHMLFQYQTHLAELLKEINTLSKSFEEYRIIQSIPNIVDKIAAISQSEVYDINEYSNDTKLVANAGFVASVFESGKFKASINRTTKRGSARLRQSIYTAVQCGLAKERNKKLTTFYNRKRNEGKPHKVAIIACANKLVHWIHAMLKRQEEFVDLV